MRQCASTPFRYTVSRFSRGGPYAQTMASKPPLRALVKPAVSFRSAVRGSYVPGNSEFQVFGGFRDMPVTVCPRESSSSTTHEPHCPFGPMTPTFSLRVSIVQRGRAGYCFAEISKHLKLVGTQLSRCGGALTLGNPGLIPTIISDDHVGSTGSAFPTTPLRLSQSF